MDRYKYIFTLYDFFSKSENLKSKVLYKQWKYENFHMKSFTLGEKIYD